MRVLTATIAVFLTCAGAASANPARYADFNPCLSSTGHPVSERLVICSETVAAQTSPKVQVEARMERGKLYMSIADWRRALADFLEVVHRAPSFAPGYAALAQARAADGNIAGAIKEYDEAIKLEPQNANFWAGRCWMQARLGRNLGAGLSDCEQGLSLNPDAYNARGARAFIHLLQRDYGAAISDFDAELVSAVSDVGARAYALYGRGIAKLLEGHDEGRSDLNDAQRIDPTIGDQFRTWGFGP